MMAVRRGQHPTGGVHRVWHNASSLRNARVEAMTAAGVGVEETARRLGRHRSTVYRELGRGCGRGGYDARGAQAAADRRARRPKTPVLAADACGCRKFGRGR